eukprot:545304_1
MGFTDFDGQYKKHKRSYQSIPTRSYNDIGGRDTNKYFGGRDTNKFSDPEDELKDMLKNFDREAEEWNRELKQLATSENILVHRMESADNLGLKIHSYSDNISRIIRRIPKSVTNEMGIDEVKKRINSITKTVEEFIKEIREAEQAKEAEEERQQAKEAEDERLEKEKPAEAERRENEEKERIERKQKEEEYRKQAKEAEDER